MFGLCRGAVCTFAGPLVGNSEFAAFMSSVYGPNALPGKQNDNRLFRIVHGSDIVPRVCHRI